MVEGADTMLDVMSGGSQQINLMIDRQSFAGADLLTLIEVCDPLVGGGYYNLEMYEGKKINQRMWLCAVTEYVFGDLPEQIYVKPIR